MPTLVLSAPPELGADARYRDYRDWLLRNYHDHLCSYCLLRDDGVQVEHYEPVRYAPHREHDPANLMLGCDRCNGPGGKGDYHPRHSTRRRLPHDATGHLVIDSRVDDYALLYEIGADGSISVLPGEGRDRASWNVVLLKLDYSLCEKRRREILRLLEACELLVRNMDDDRSRRHVDEQLLQQLLPHLAGYHVFIRVFGIAISESLTARLSPLVTGPGGSPSG